MGNENIDISEFPVMKNHCASCPFKRDESGRERDPLLANRVRMRLLEASQICHHPRLSGNKETHLCRGARDEQLTLMHRFHVIEEPTDEAWKKRRQSVFAAE